MASTIINISYQSGTPVTIDEPTLKNHNHLKSVVCIGFTLDVHSVGLDKCIMTCIHHYGIIQKYFHCPKYPLCSVQFSWHGPQKWSINLLLSIKYIFRPHFIIVILALRYLLPYLFCRPKSEFYILGHFKSVVPI